MHRLLSMMLLCGLLVGGSGCMSIAKRGLKEAKGAGSKARAIPGTITGGLARFRGVQIATPRTDVGGLVDARFRGVLAGHLREALTQGEEPIFPGGSPTMRIEPEITWYHEAGSLGDLMGSDSFAIGLFWLSADGADLGRVQVVTKSGATRTGPEELAESMADGLAEFFEKQRKE